MDAPAFKPIIGISSNIMEAERRKFYDNLELQMIETSMADAIIRAGGLPVVYPIIEDPLDAKLLMRRLDGVIFSGGTDIDPSFYGEELMNDAWAGQKRRDRSELLLLVTARQESKPVLGICRGCQLINVGYGGTLFQDLQQVRGGDTREHRNQELYANNKHRTTIQEGNPLAEILGAGERITNSVHHQGLKKVGLGLEVIAEAEDGVVEAVWAPEEEYVLGIQWHPEWMQEEADMRAIFRHFVQACYQRGGRYLGWRVHFDEEMQAENRERSA